MSNENHGLSKRFKQELRNILTERNWQTQLQYLTGRRHYKPVNENNETNNVMELDP
jgi:hypothetical protein